MAIAQERDWFLTTFNTWRDRLVEEAVEARRRAVNYRDFRVGAAILAYNKDTSSFRIFPGSNVMDAPWNIDVPARTLKVCAEQMALHHAQTDLRQWGDPSFDKLPHFVTDLIVGLVVMGEPQKDSLSGLSNVTLHPCWQCRVMLQAEETISPNTIFLGITPDLKKQELMRVDEVVALHATHWPDRQERHMAPRHS